ncbi:uncharacterized protein STEHIDRAFT_171040 [Stereum hirsutum FP-91666 SS1]|uniref:uncharacterized protein n=1 Tax=Stereum hirsutum (strain FP-91666) TaxID=721885 RepID=UPI0004449F73|nr:uncharacterized protein STEHIDRAFT_171040 [Stereum hirsutum FP-91666 SS1]EIM82891.1 hypothetical protein STEHIDRAFT_171040 [Stereum hirsutum FP-91666 SS1]
MSTDTKLDPYTAKATNNDLTTQQKITDLHKIVKGAGIAMLVSRASSGHLHSRAMAPAGPTSDSQTTLVFITNNATEKVEEIENDDHVNVSFYDNSTTSWASYCGIATIVNDKELIKKHWNPMVAGYFGDLGDGIHKGDVNDPRVSAIQVTPEEIHYWFSTSGAVSRTAQVAVGAVTGKTAAPGELRTITQAEIQLTQGLHTK